MGEKYTYEGAGYRLGLVCLECKKPMHGIKHYKVREVCEPCGGESLMCNSEEAERLIRKRVAGSSSTGTLPEGHDGWAA